MREKKGGKLTAEVGRNPKDGGHNKQPSPDDRVDDSTSERRQGVQKQGRGREDRRDDEVLDAVEGKAKAASQLGQLGARSEKGKGSGGDVQSDGSRSLGVLEEAATEAAALANLQDLGEVARWAPARVAMLVFEVVEVGSLGGGGSHARGLRAAGGGRRRKEGGSERFFLGGKDRAGAGGGIARRWGTIGFPAWCKIHLGI